MENNIINPCNEHVTHLIPWFVTNQLNDEDLILVTEHVENCADCTKIVEQERKMAAALKQSYLAQNITEIPSKWEEFQAKIHNSDINNIDVHEEQESDGTSIPIPTNVIRFPTLHRVTQKLKQPKTLGYIAMAQAAALVALITIPNMTTGPAIETNEEYNTLSNGEVNANQQANAIIQLRSGVAIEAMDSVFAENNIHIVGVTATNAYMINISGGNIEKTVLELRSNDNITLAEPIGAE